MTSTSDEAFWRASGHPEEFWTQPMGNIECVVFRAFDELKGSVPVKFLGSNAAGVGRWEHRLIIPAVIQAIRNCSRPVASFKKAIAVKRLFETCSGKILGSTIQKSIPSKPYKVPATIDHLTISGKLKDTLTGIGCCKKKDTRLFFIGLSLVMPFSAESC